MGDTRPEKRQSEPGTNQVMRAGIARRTLSDGRVVYYAVTRYRDALGRVKQAWLGPHDREREADEHRTRFKSELLEGRRPQSRKEAKAYTVSVLLDDWLASIEPDLAESTVRSYRRRAELHIRPLLGQRPLSELDPSDVEAFKAALRTRGLGLAGQSQVYQTLSAAFKYAVRMRRLAQSPTAFVSWPAYRAPKRPIVSEEDAARIIEATRGARLGLAIELILYTGLRRAEVINLRWAEVDLDAGTLLVGKSKTPAGVRLFPLPPAVVDLLKAHRPDSVSRQDFVFTRSRSAGRRSRPGAPLALDALDKAWKAIREPAGYPHLHLHDLRHAFATIALRAGVDLVHVAELLGHKDASITARVYSHVTAEGRREAAEKVAEALRRGQESHIARKLLDGVLDGPASTRDGEAF